MAIFTLIGAGEYSPAIERIMRLLNHRAELTDELGCRIEIWLDT
jgi:hypothetical protein